MVAERVFTCARNLIIFLRAFSKYLGEPSRKRRQSHAIHGGGVPLVGRHDIPSALSVDIFPEDVFPMAIEVELCEEFRVMATMPRRYYIVGNCLIPGALLGRNVDRWRERGFDFAIR
ncbi:hypothetical protein SERLA73DRAFT_176250 [Serpula lacrymans var. lacrymans S7.3]|uniref:Uncharacterized protein n=2 Tax=Serpula lacrymans var. lacrymans TaxID=341189 RepID=F8PMK7_SERL3|nr:uncharacterized protein SERLADRAFT_459052 [Serpula lacrymans var. lacrymans S7.9]EGO02839.1 hypothetical protein SERLA73DRAFT_176250 [Serpula lacrymans var. lacrymans S7.3]EGO28533.1 hypothetical protein SERLADRAFT_459052 [Serpula lacrymans var. lacrymans S7.9]